MMVLHRLFSSGRDQALLGKKRRPKWLKKRAKERGSG